MPDDRPLDVVTSHPQLAELARHLRDAGRFAFDTEFVSESTFDPELGLIQVATRDRLALVDPLAVDDLSPFWDVLHDPAVEVVMHAAGEDLWIALRRSGRLPARVVDVQLAAGFVGFGYPISLGQVIQQCVGANLSSGDTRTDWLRRPLSESQLHYALDDVRYLLQAADQIERRLEDLGRRDWVEDEYRELLRAVGSRDDLERWRRLSGLSGLSRRGLEAARRLWLWRRDQARRLNRPARHVLRDDIIITIAKKMPTTPAELEQLRDLPRGMPRDRVAALLDCVRAAKATPDADLPSPGERADESRGLTMVANLLSAVLNRCCAEHKIAAGLVGTVADLKDLARWERAGRPPDARPALAQGWRFEVAGRQLLDVVSGRSTLRVADIDSEMPLEIEPARDDSGARR
jgi:ribonuclease D